MLQGLQLLFWNRPIHTRMLPLRCIPWRLSKTLSRVASNPLMCSLDAPEVSCGCGSRGGKPFPLPSLPETAPAT